MENLICGFLGRIGLPELIVILVIVLLLFGAKKLPEIAKSLGIGLREFKKSVNDLGNDANTNKTAQQSSDKSEEHKG